MTEKRAPHLGLAAILFAFAGLIFLIAAWLSDSPALCGVGAAMFGLCVTFLGLSRAKAAK